MLEYRHRSFYFKGMAKKSKAKNLNVRAGRVSSSNPMQEADKNETYMPQGLMEQVFDCSRRLGYESEEEAKIREQKEEYNKSVIEKIKTVRLTKRQKLVLELLYVRGLGLSEAGKELGVTPQAIFKVKKTAIETIKKHVSYDFDTN